MKIGTIAEQLGTTVSTLRYYEEKDLVHPHRSVKGTRLYSKRDLNRFQAILELAALDIPIETIHGISTLRRGCATGHDASRESARQLRDIEDGLTARIDALQAAVEDLNQARKRLVACRGCRKQPLRSVCSRCAVSRDLLDTRVMHIVWDEESAASE